MSHHQCQTFETITVAALRHIVYINQINDCKFPVGAYVARPSLLWPHSAEMEAVVLLLVWLPL